MSFLPKHYTYMPAGSYSIVPEGLFEKEIDKMPSDRYERLSNATVIFHYDLPLELKKMFVKEYEEVNAVSDPNSFE